jgi:hypothetical protein
MADEPHPELFVPSLFDIATDNNFITRGMQAITAAGLKIKALEAETGNVDSQQIAALKEERKMKSVLLQQQLFESYNFLNAKGELKNVCAVFENTPNKIPNYCIMPLQMGCNHLPLQNSGGVSPLIPVINNTGSFILPVPINANQFWNICWHCRDTPWRIPTCNI